VSQFGFRGLRSLDTLDLSDNLLPQLPNEALSQLQQLLRLHVSGNPISQIGRHSFQSLFTLEELELSRMYKLAAIGGHAFIDNAKLKKLVLEDNPELAPLPWGLFATNSLLQDVSYRNNSWSV
jgi:Leucine-rich repeat (LRR) protein